jgi:hypothetical protein
MRKELLETLGLSVARNEASSDNAIASYAPNADFNPLMKKWLNAQVNWAATS